MSARGFRLIIRSFMMPAMFRLARVLGILVYVAVEVALMRDRLVVGRIGIGRMMAGMVAIAVPIQGMVGGLRGSSGSCAKQTCERDRSDQSGTFSRT
jgi:hypothetical protein